MGPGIGNVYGRAGLNEHPSSLGPAPPRAPGGADTGIAQALQIALSILEAGSYSTPEIVSSGNVRRLRPVGPYQVLKNSVLVGFNFQDGADIRNANFL